MPRTRTDGDGHGLPPVRRRVHVPALVGGLLLVVGSALAFGLLAQQLRATRPVLVLAQPADRGTVLTTAHLGVAEINADAALTATPADQRDALVGGTLMTSLPAGAPVSEDLVLPSVVDPGPATRTVGLALDPGGYPTTTLTAGDVVSVVATSGRGNVLDERAVVLAVEATMEGSATQLVSVAVDTPAAAGVAAAAARDQVRLVLHGAAP